MEENKEGNELNLRDVVFQYVEGKYKKIQIGKGESKVFIGMISGIKDSPENRQVVLMALKPEDALKVAKVLEKFATDILEKQFGNQM
jgi:hypothetical protein